MLNAPVPKNPLSILGRHRRHKATLVLVGCIGLVLLLSVNDRAQAQISQSIAAIVNDDVISSYDVQQRTRLVMSSSGVDSTPQVVNRIQAQVLRSLIDEKLQTQEAAEYEVEITEEEVASAIERLGRQNDISSSDIEDSLEKAGISFDTLRGQILAEIAWGKLVNGLLSPRVSVTSDEVDYVLQQLTSNSDKPQYLVSEVFLTIDSQEQEQEVFQGGLQLIDQMRQGVSFPTIAQQFSSSPSSAQGGDVGWVQDGEMPTELNETLRRMQPGQISSPIRTRGGYVILALRDRRFLGGPDPMASTIDLSQIVVPLPKSADAKTIEKLQDDAESIHKALEGCSNLDSAAKSVESAVISKLGRLKISQISVRFQPVAAALRVGEASEPIRTDTGFHILIVCDREDAGEAPPLPSRVQIEERLFDQQLSTLARRYLRDLRRDSTIELR